MIGSNKRRDIKIPGAALSSPIMDRRGFLKATAAATGGIFISMKLGGCASTQDVLTPQGGFVPNAWLRFRPDGQLVFILDRVEMGQGTQTSHLQLLAEELEVDPASILVEHAPPGDDYRHTLYFLQTTGGSASVASSWDVLRQAGATVREALRAGAAATWGVPLAEVVAQAGELRHDKRGLKATYQEMAAAAVEAGIPDEVTLKDPKDWQLIGKPIGRLDLQPKTTGGGIYTMDVAVPNMRYAVLVRCPTFGGTPSAFDDTKVLQRKGVEAVVQVDNGVAIIADSYWTARQAVPDLHITWDKGKNADTSSASIDKRYRELLEGDDLVEVRAEGAPDDELKQAAKTLDAIYELPYLAHATMEPQVAVAHLVGDKLKVWAPCQTPDIGRALAAQVAGVDEEQVELKVLYPGGGFGRRLGADYVAEVVGIAKQVPFPVKLIWSREDDTRHGFFRPSSLNVMQGAIGGDGKPTLWRHHMASQSLMTQLMPEWIPEMLPDWTPSVVAAWRAAPSWPPSTTRG